MCEPDAFSVKIRLHPTCFNASVCNIGSFPRKGLAKVIYSGIKDENSSFLRIYDHLYKKLSTVISKPKNRYQPHLTIGRVRKHQKCIIPKILIDKQFLIEDLVIFESVLTSKGVIYNELFKVKLNSNNI